MPDGTILHAPRSETAADRLSAFLAAAAALDRAALQSLTPMQLEDVGRAVRHLRGDVLYEATWRGYSADKRRFLA